MASSYRVAVGSFEGPFDLLLHLIARRKLDVHEIPIAEITEDYLAVLRRMEECDLEVTTDFLVVAATLLELKAARLLPHEEEPDIDELELETRDLLYARLLDYRRFRRGAALIAERLADNDGYLPREVLLEDRYRRLVPRVEVPVTAAELAAMAARVLADQPDRAVDLSHVQPVRMTVQEAGALLAGELARAGGHATFAQLTAGCRHRVETIACFLALLELYKLEIVEVDQAASFGDLAVTACGDVRGGDWAEAAAAALPRDVAAAEG